MPVCVCALRELAIEDTHHMYCTAYVRVCVMGYALAIEDTNHMYCTVFVTSYALY